MKHLIFLIGIIMLITSSCNKEEQYHIEDRTLSFQQEQDNLSVKIISHSSSRSDEMFLFEYPEGTAIQPNLYAIPKEYRYIYKDSIGNLGITRGAQGTCTCTCGSFGCEKVIYETKSSVWCAVRGCACCLPGLSILRNDSMITVDKISLINLTDSAYTIGYSFFDIPNNTVVSETISSSGRVTDIKFTLPSNFVFLVQDVDSEYYLSSTAGYTLIPNSASCTMKLLDTDVLVQALSKGVDCKPMLTVDSVHVLSVRVLDLTNF